MGSAKIMTVDHDLQAVVNLQPTQSQLTVGYLHGELGKMTHMS